jgi:hypothetical protein
MSDIDVTIGILLLGGTSFTITRWQVSGMSPMAELNVILNHLRFAG